MLSKANPTEKVLNCPLNVNINYADRALRLAHDLALSESSKLVWLRARDVETRSTMIGLMRQGWPQGEALTKAQKEHALEWASGPKQKSDADTSAELLGGERDRGRHDRQGQQKRKFLSDWQQRSGDAKVVANRQTKTVHRERVTTTRETKEKAEASGEKHALSI